MHKHLVVTITMLALALFPTACVFEQPPATEDVKEACAVFLYANQLAMYDHNTQVDAVSGYTYNPDTKTLTLNSFDLAQFATVANTPLIDAVTYTSKSGTVDSSSGQSTALVDVTFEGGVVAGLTMQMQATTYYDDDTGKTTLDVTCSDITANEFRLEESIAFDYDYLMSLVKTQ